MFVEQVILAMERDHLCLGKIQEGSGCLVVIFREGS